MDLLYIQISQGSMRITLILKIIKQLLLEDKDKMNLKLKAEYIALIVILFFVGLFLFIDSKEGNMPPTDVAGHVESYPPSKAMKTAIPIEVHKHILEHTPSGRPGVIINYNCVKFECSPSLIDKLESYALQYPHVYTYPMEDMDAKIVLTKIRDRLVLDELDENKITSFIES